ncbi:MAG: glycosyltransferase family 9 protein, partial [Candidatus Binatia bacterium]
LRQSRYDAIVDLRTAFLPWVLRADRRAARWRAAQSQHAVEQHFAIASKMLEGAPEIPDPCVWISDADQAFAAAAFRRYGGMRCLALAPGANWPGKIWPLHRFRELIELGTDHFDLVAIFGGSQDRTITAELAAGCRLPVIDFAGATSLTEAAALLDHATAFVGNDSGLGHLSAARNIRTLTLFGRGKPERYRPWGKRVAVVEAPQRELSLLRAEVVAQTLFQLLES